MRSLQGLGWRSRSSRNLAHGWPGSRVSGWALREPDQPATTVGATRSRAIRFLVIFRTVQLDNGSVVLGGRKWAVGRVVCIRRRSEDLLGTGEAGVDVGRSK